VNGQVDATFNSGADASSAADDFLSDVSIVSALYQGTAFASSSLFLRQYPSYAMPANMYFTPELNNFIISGCNPALSCPPTTPSPWEFLVMRPFNPGAPGSSSPQYANTGTGVSLDDRVGFGTWTLTADTSPVPLPAAAWLLLSGLGALGALGRRRKAT
jgi:hypothetical protein